MKTFKEDVRSFSVSIGIDKIGFTDTSDFSYLKEGILKMKPYSTGFEHRHLEERLFPELVLEGAKSIISIGLAYPSDYPPVSDRNSRGRFARASFGVDYHVLLREKLDALIEFMKERFPEARFKGMVDTGELIDVAVAARAGLGFVGKNTLLISKEFGSYLYLGEIITTLEFEVDAPVDYDCGDCNRCVRACPVSAIVGDGSFLGNVCLSYQTQAKGIMGLEVRQKNRDMLYGCDICQVVCPYNKGINFDHHEKMRPIVDEVNPKLSSLFPMNNKEFKKRFGHLAGAWRGKSVIQRNAIIAMGNSRKSEFIPLLKELCKDEREAIRASSVWALSKLLKKEEFVDLLNECLKVEKVPEIAQDMLLSLKSIDKQ